MPRRAPLVLLLVLAVQCAYTVSVEPLKIYIYDLPRWKNFTAHGDIRDSDYGLDQVFPELLKVSKYVTTNPEEADYFFADAWIFWPHALNPISEIVASIRALGPWFQRSGGSDHIFVITADQGRCQYNYQETQFSIFLHHYGGNLHGGEFFTNERSLLEHWGGEYDREMVLAEALRAEDHCRRKGTPCVIDKHNRGMPLFCHEPFQDIVIPPSNFERRASRDIHHGSFHVANDLAFTTPWTDDRAAALSAQREILLFHQGGTHMYQAEFYSLGARQTFVKMFGHKRINGFVLTPSEMSGDYWTSMLRSIFCLATTGTGWGSRFKVAVAKGCIPLIVMDGVKSEFEEQLPLKEYAVRMPLYMAYRAPEILMKFIETGRVKEMQENLKCAWRLHYWRAPHGKAFEVVMCELKRRKLNLTGLIPVDFKACTMQCGDEVINLLEDSPMPAPMPASGPT